MKPKFLKELESLLNCNSIDNDLNTPDFILVDFINSCLLAYKTTKEANEKWHGQELRCAKD